MFAQFIQKIEETIEEKIEEVKNWWEWYIRAGPWRDPLLENKLEKILFETEPSHDWVDDDTIHYYSDNDFELFVTHFDDGIKKIRVKTTTQKMNEIDNALKRVQKAESNGYEPGTSIFLANDEQKANDDVQVREYESFRPRSVVPH